MTGVYANITLPVKYTPSSRSLPSSSICGMDSWRDLDLANLDSFSYNIESTCLPKSAEFSGMTFSAKSLLSTSIDLPLFSDFFTRDIPKITPHNNMCNDELILISVLTFMLCTFNYKYLRRFKRIRWNFITLYKLCK